MKLTSYAIALAIGCAGYSDNWKFGADLMNSLGTASGPSAFHVVVGIASQAMLISFYRFVRGGVGDLEESILWVVTAVAAVWLILWMTTPREPDREERKASEATRLWLREWVWGGIITLLFALAAFAIFAVYQDVRSDISGTEWLVARSVIGLFLMSLFIWLLRIVSRREDLA